MRSGLIGRACELADLRAALEDACSGRGSTVLVGGDAGVGKTRLVSALVDDARAAGASVLNGRCIDLAGPGVPLFAVFEALGRFGTGGGAAPNGANPPVRLVRTGSGPVVNAQWQLFHAVEAMLGERAAEAPVVLVLEDLHWADASTLDFVSFLSRTNKSRRVLLVGTYRSDDMNPAGRLARVVVELVRARSATKIDLQPLGRADLGHLLEGIAGRRIPEDLMESIVARSGGNPFFAEELLAAAERGAPALPQLLRYALLQRVAGVDEAGRDVLKAVAAYGRGMPHRFLTVLIDEPPARLNAALRQAVEHGVLVADGPSAGYRFRHALLAEVVYATILPGEAEELHGRIAQALTTSRLAGDATAAGELARHWIAAGESVPALVCCIQAARDAEAVFGLAEALRHLDRAIDLWPEVKDPAELVGMDESSLLAWAAELADLTGAGRLARELVRRAIALVDCAADPVLAGRLHERLSAYLMPSGDREAALVACRHAVALVPADPPSVERVTALTTLGNVLMLLWRHTESREVCVEALETARAVGDARAALRAEAILGVDLCYLGHPEKARRRAVAACTRALDVGTARDVAHSYANLCEVLIASGQIVAAGRAATEGLEQARRLGVERSFGALLAAYAAEACMLTGSWDRAEVLLDKESDTGNTFWVHYPNLLRAELAAERGDWRSAHGYIASAAVGERQPTSAPRYARVVAGLALWQCQPELAAGVIDAALARCEAGRSALHRARLAALGVRAQADRIGFASVHRDIDSERSARVRAAELLEMVRRAAADAIAITPEAVAWHATAEAEYERGMRRPGPARWRTAVDAWESVGNSYQAAYCRWRLVEIALSGGTRTTSTGSGISPEAAVRIAREAYRVASTLGATPLRRALEALAERARIDLTGLIPAEPSDGLDPLGLTARQREVLQLLTRGYTNRQIAAELTISDKTASVHVTHILRRLGVARRFDAAAIAQRLNSRQDNLPNIA